MRRKKRIVLLTSYILAAFIALGGLAYSYHLKVKEFELQLENDYQRAFSEVVCGVGELDTALQKSLYSTSTAMLSSVCTEVYGKAQAAQYALGELPFSTDEFQNTSGFITKVGDYAYMLSKKAGSGKTISEEEQKNLIKLSQTATVLADNLNQLMADINNNGVSVGKMEAVSSTAAKVGSDATSNILKDSFTIMEGEFPETPTLIYDGPFSSHIAGMTPKLLEGKEEITAEDALKRAAAFLGTKNSILKPMGERGGNLPVYMFYANDDGGTLSFEVTKKGGIVSDVFNSRLVKTSVISQKDAVRIATNFLRQKGYQDMQQSYQYADGNTLTVNYAYTKDGVVCYTDLIKISVALDNGRIVGFESQGYIMNHTERTIPAVQVDETEAQKKVSPLLKVLAHDLAIIPTSGKSEVFCHEFKCENSDGNRYIVYVNAETGAEEKILILLESSSGTLTI
jgi:germination protein YpeB